MKIANPIGKKGEEVATEYLIKKGFKILEKNFRKSYAEIDIIAISPNKKILVFFEVKTRTSTTYGTPFEAITYWKLKPLTKLAQFYAAIHPNLPQELRIDAIGVILNNNLEIISIEHLESIT